MTVTNVNRKNKCSCAFFVGDALQKIKLPMNSLENVTKTSYDVTEILPEKERNFTEFVQSRDDSEATNLVDDSSLTVLTSYIKEDQPLVLARMENSEVTLPAFEPAAMGESAHE